MSVNTFPVVGPERIRRAWAQLGLGAFPERWEGLPPQASLRRYVRLRRGEERFIAMVMPQGTGPEEIGGMTGAEPFLVVQRYLEERDIPVPRIYGHVPDEGVVVLEDLGDWTLEQGLYEENMPRSMGEGWDDLETAYERAVDLLVNMQVASGDAFSCDGPWRATRFDRALLDGEWEHFVEYLLAEGAHRADLAGDPRVNRAGEELVRSILEQPYGFTHRDVQSRNLMITPRGLVLIDFQDALGGPDVYDLVALLRDSYVVLPDEILQRLLRRYYDAHQLRGSEKGAYPEFLERFYRVTLHRKAKDAGRFVYIDRVKGNPDFLPHIPASLDYVRDALERLAGFAELAEALAPIWDIRDFSARGDGARS